MTLPYVICREGIDPPYRGHPGDAGLDLQAAIDVEIPPLERLKVPTGIAMEIPDGHVGLIVPRSGYAIEHGITHLDGPGIIDSGYRGEVHFLLYNTDKEHTFRVLRGERLGQIVIVPFARLRPVRVAELGPGDRGLRKHGSTGMAEPASLLPSQR